MNATLSSSSMIQNDRGSTRSQAMAVASEPTRTMPKAIADPSDRCDAIRVRSGTLANRQPRLYRPSRPLTTSRTRTTKARIEDERGDPR